MKSSLFSLVLSVFAITHLLAQPESVSTLYLQNGETAKGIVIEIGDEFVDFEEVFPDGVRARQKISKSNVYRLVSSDGQVLISNPRIKDELEKPSAERTDRPVEQTFRVRRPTEKPPASTPKTEEPTKEEPSPKFDAGKVDITPPVPRIETPESGPGSGPSLSTYAIIAMARANAMRQHKPTAWRLGGGLVSCGAAILGGMVGGGLAEFPGFLIGAGLGSFGTPVLLASISTQPPTPPLVLSYATPEQIESYGHAYMDEARKLRRNSIFGGELRIAGAVVVGGCVLILLAISSF